eukprot:scaffold8023_cov103-Isochrysis_galbana.AAC.20
MPARAGKAEHATRHRTKRLVAGEAHRGHRQKLWGTIRHVLLLERAARRVRADRTACLGASNLRNQPRAAEHRLAHEHSPGGIQDAHTDVIVISGFGLGQCSIRHRICCLKSENRLARFKPFAQRAACRRRRTTTQPERASHANCAHCAQFSRARCTSLHGAQQEELHRHPRPQTRMLTGAIVSATEALESRLLKMEQHL